MYKRIFTVLTAAVLAAFLLFVLGPLGAQADPRCHVIAHVG